MGKACVQEFVAQGHHVIAVLSPGKSIENSNKKNTTAYNANLMDEVETTKLIDKIVVEHKTIEAALFLVGGFAMGTIEETDGAQIKKMLGLNFETAYYTSRKIFMQMTKQSGGGRLVFVGAKPVLNAAAGKNLVAYALSKTLIFKLAELLNAEGNSKNIVSTVIVPSIIDSEANRKSMPKADPSDWVTPAEIAEVISFATSENGNKLREPIFKIYGNA